MNDKHWFIERIGKKVYRSNVGCKCSVCNDNYTNGLIIIDELHAIYLYDIQQEGIARYFDSIDERNEYDKAN